MPDAYPSLHGSLALALALLGPTLTARAAASPAPPAPPSTNVSPAAALTVGVPRSVFVVPTSPKQGRNPFFPRSGFHGPATEPKPQPVPTSAIVLNGLTSPPRASAMINGRTFETGESGQIKLPNGTKVQVKCLEIRPPDAAVAIIGAERRELRLRHAH
jgi:hypothetical protein